MKEIQRDVEKRRWTSLVELLGIENEEDINLGYCGIYACMLALELEKEKIPYRIFHIPFIHTWVVVDGVCYDYGLLNGKKMDRKVYMEALNLEEYDFSSGVNYKDYQESMRDEGGSLVMDNRSYPRPELHWSEESGYVSLHDYLLRICTPFNSPSNEGFFDDELRWLLELGEDVDLSEIKKRLFYNSYGWRE